MAERKKMTQAGLDKLQAELDHLVGVVRNEIAKEIEFARSYGDLSENAEYTEAKKRQAENETKIAELEDIIKVAEVIDDDEITSDKVSLGTTVTLKTLSETDEDFMTVKGEVVRYAIVGDNEADPLRNRISDESEVGRTLIGASLGETVEIPLDGYTLVYLVQSIEKGDAL